VQGVNLDLCIQNRHKSHCIFYGLSKSVLVRIVFLLRCSPTAAVYTFFGHPTSCKKVIRLVVTYGCEAWTLTNRDEQHLRICDRRILRKISGPVQNEDGS